jgi:hypothetical protein
MISTFVIMSYLAAVLALLDQVRRPASVWAAADRNRGSWIWATVILGFLACGIFVACAYLVVVVPRFTSADDVDSAFRKQR